MGRYKTMVVRWQTFEQYHNKKNIGSTNIRVHNLIKYWPETALYKYGEKADVMIFQKVYCTYDYKLPKHYPGIRILDTCDPDWQQTPDIHIAETVRNVDATVVPTKNLQKYLQQMTDKPVVVIKDRFDLSEFPAKKVHKGKLKTAVWFGYSHNAELLRYAIGSLEKRGIKLIVVSNEDPMAYRWCDDSVAYEANYQFIKYDQATIYDTLQLADVCVLPKGYRPEDKFKSENKTVIAQLCGLPVVTDADELDKMMTAEARNNHINAIYDTLRAEYDCKKSVQEYQELIKEIQNGNTKI